MDTVAVVAGTPFSHTTISGCEGWTVVLPVAVDREPFHVCAMMFPSPSEPSYTVHCGIGVCTILWDVRTLSEVTRHVRKVSGASVTQPLRDASRTTDLLVSRGSTSATVHGSAGHGRGNRGQRSIRKNDRPIPRCLALILKLP